MIIVEGRIRGKQRPRFSTKTGKAFTPKDTVNYENWIKLNYQEQSGRYLQGAIRARIEAYYKIPKSYSKKRVQSILEGKEHYTKKCDVDNLAKIILDSINKIAYDDDAQVVELTVIKRYTEGIERIEFELEEIK